jgi:hypothetical protein
VRLRLEARRALVLVLLLAAAAHARAQGLDGDLPLASGRSPTREQTATALAAAQADPNIAVKRTIRTLRWDRASEQPPPRSGATPAWVEWIGGLFSWLARSGRVLVWVVAGLLVLAVAVYLVRYLRLRGPAPAAKKFVAPTHVRDLDIRPESLPDDVGAAAFALWNAGEQRAALALLYRGLLSRLVHAHAVPIRDSSTEGDCLALAGPRLNEPRRRYAARLVRTWQRAVYGGEPLESAAVHALCAEFAPLFGVRPPESAAARETA